MTAVTTGSHRPVCAQTLKVLEEGLKAILCIGELKEERESGETFNVCDVQARGARGCHRRFKIHSVQNTTTSTFLLIPVLPAQLTEGLKGVSAEMMKDVVIAYEPVWAIGTGLTATPEVRSPQPPPAQLVAGWSHVVCVPDRAPRAIVDAQRPRENGSCAAGRW